MQDLQSLLLNESADCLREQSNNSPPSPTDLHHRKYKNGKISHCPVSDFNFSPQDRRADKGLDPELSMNEEKRTYVSRALFSRDGLVLSPLDVLSYTLPNRVGSVFLGSDATHTTINRQHSDDSVLPRSSYSYRYTDSRPLFSASTTAPMQDLLQSSPESSSSFSPLPTVFSPIPGALGYTRKKMRRCNSTSTLFVLSTMSKPVIDPAIAGVAMEIYKYFSNSTHSTPFDEPVLVPLHYAPVTANDIYEFITHIFHKGQLEADTIIITLVYTERVLTMGNGMLLTAVNWRPIILVAMLLASKVWDDMSMWNKDFSIFFPSMATLKQLNKWEVLFLERINYDVGVPASLYAEIYFR